MYDKGCGFMSMYRRVPQRVPDRYRKRAAICIERLGRLLNSYHRAAA